MKAPLPPAYLHQWPAAVSAWTRIVGRLVRRGEWEAIFVPAAAAASFQVAVYAALVDVPELAGEREETRQLARAWLREMGYLAPGRASVGLLDQAGRDIDLMRLCVPPEPA